MNHLMKGRKFGHGTAYNKALRRNLHKSLIQHESISTTLAKAKEIRSSVEKLVTLGKEDTLANRRRAISLLGGNAPEVSKLFEKLGPRFAARNGGYTRIYKNGNRKGDCAPMAIIQFVE